mmetsp:Transcript_24817/g.56336  ORF Transcript_24817/g.56336 Transcript_24817/m.56336 type:complete len:118 (+) Transcript_24817:1109-1462(+)
MVEGWKAPACLLAQMQGLVCGMRGVAEGLRRAAQYALQRAGVPRRLSQESPPPGADQEGDTDDTTRFAMFLDAYYSCLSRAGVAGPVGLLALADYGRQAQGSAQASVVCSMAESIAG